MKTHPEIQADTAAICSAEFCSQYVQIFFGRNQISEDAKNASVFELQLSMAIGAVGDLCVRGDIVWSGHDNYEVELAHAGSGDTLE
jgi:hypothetical protein